jgi:hypothetical protein
MSGKEDMGRADETEDIFRRGKVRGSEFRRRHICTGPETLSRTLIIIY